MQAEPLTFRFADDGEVPNHPTLPMLVYRGVIDVAAAHDPLSRIESIFTANGWSRDLWRNGIYPFTHYHSMTHEVLGIAAGRARVRFGGAGGEELELEAGDVAVLPAGTGHQRVWASPDLCVIGAYPREGTYDLCRAGGSERERALRAIPLVPAAESDPVYGAEGPLRRLWNA